jgi:hypothetical protein
MDKGLDSSIYGLMQTGRPLKSYIKTVLGKVYVTVLNPFNEMPEGRLLIGNPKDSNREGCIVDIWSEKEDVFFKRSNRKHLETGIVIPHIRKEVVEEKFENNLSDTELDKILSEPFISLQRKINKLSSVAPIFRLLERARELEKSEKLINYLEKRLSEIQEKDFSTEDEV